DTSLPRMPTPTATPRGVATPRAGEEATLALEDGNTQEAAAGEEVSVTVSKSLEDVQGPRPSTANSVLSCLSDSTAGSGPSRPGTGDTTAKPSDAEAEAAEKAAAEKAEAEKEAAAKAGKKQSLWTESGMASFAGEGASAFQDESSIARDEAAPGERKSFGDLVSETNRRPST
ncbi:ALDH3A2, partial [Symbiodinium pilosum]